MANKIYAAIALTGGGTGALDKINGGVLNDADCAVVIDAVNNKAYLYTLDASSGAAESSPDVISPDTSPGNKRWLLVDTVAVDGQFDNIQVLTAAGDLIIKNQAGSTIATFGDAQTLLLLNGTTINEFSVDGTLAGDSDDAVPTEKAVKTYVDNAAGGINADVGIVRRPQFTFTDTDTITISGFRYHHKGTAEQTVWSDADIVYDFGSGGDNALSEDLGASEWHYLYLDDSAIVTAGVAQILAAQLVNNTTAPTWNASELGFYNGNDRCIMMFYSNSSSQIDEFWHFGDKILWGTEITILAAAGWTTSFADVTCRLPNLAVNQQAVVTLNALVGLSTQHYWRPNGSSGSGHLIGYNFYTSGGDDTRYITTNTLSVITDTSEKIEVKVLSGTGEASTLYQNGYGIPIGM
jgi:hypothetical protein